MRDDAAPGPLTHGSAARAGGGHGLSASGTGMQAAAPAGFASRREERGKGSFEKGRLTRDDLSIHDAAEPGSTWRLLT